MKKVIMLLCALLCFALLTGCGADPGIPNPDAPAINENAPPTTDSETINATYFEKDESPAPRLLSYQMDENGIFYIPREAWPEYYVFTGEISSTDLPQQIYGTVRVKFRYDSKDWLIQLWKGLYESVMLSCEIGIGAKPPTQQAEHYFPIKPDEELVFKMDVYQKSFLTGKTTHLFTRGPEKAAWFNGFVPGSFFEQNKKEEIIVVGSITFPDEGMLRAFEASFARAGFSRGKPGKGNPEKYAIDGTTLTFSWQAIDQDA